MKKIFTYSMILAAGFLYSSCAKEQTNVNDESPVVGKPIEFTIADIDSKVVYDAEGNVNWEDGDQVGLFYYVDDVLTSTNVPYEYDADKGKFYPVDAAAVWSGTADNKHDIYAYYPYRTDGAETADKISVSLTSSQEYDAAAEEWTLGSKYGFAYTRALSVAYGEQITMDPLSQYLSVLRLNITNGTDEDITISEVNVSCDKYLNGYMKISLMDETEYPKQVSFSDNTSPKNISVTVTNGSVAAGEAIDVRLSLRPRTFSDATFTVTVTSDKGEHPAVTFTGKDLTYGQRAVKAITIDAVEAVETEGYSIGDLVEGGMLYWISEDKASGKVLSLERSNLAWYTSATFSGIDLTSLDGSENIATLKTLVGDDLTDYPAVKYCDDYAVGGGDWYLPSGDDYKELFAVYNGTTWNDRSTTYEALTDDEKASRELFESYLAVLGGEKLDAEYLGDDSSKKGDKMWTSSTNNSKYARWIRFGTSTYEVAGGSSSQGTNTSNRYARCIKKVTLSE